MKKGLGVVAKEAKMRGRAFGSGIEDKLIGKQLAKRNLGYQIGDMIGGGVRSAMRSRKGGHDIKTTELIASLAKKTPETILNMSNQKQYVFLAGQKAILTDKLLPYTLSESDSDSFELQ